MNILMITLFSLERNTSVAISNINITKGLLSLGHKVTWVMPNWDKCETEFDSLPVRVIRVSGRDLNRNVCYMRRKIRSHFEMLDFTKSYILNWRKVQIPDEYYDVVISTSDPKTSHVFTSKILRKIQYGKWIQHWGDPMYGDITRNFWWPNWFIKFYEWNILRKADKIIYVTPFTCQQQQVVHPKLACKISFVPLPADMYITKTIQDPNRLRVVYLGDYSPSIRNLRPLFDACTSLDFVKLVIAGHGPNYPKHPNATILPRIPHSQALEYENSADVIFSACNLRGTQIPGKVMYKTSSDKHILVALEKDKDVMRSYFDSFNRLTICENTKESIVEALNFLRTRTHEYNTPNRLTPINVAKEILS